MSHPPFLPAEHLHPHTVAYVPQLYEPNYAYPLLVLFHAHDGDENQMLRLMPRLSDRNYIALSLRGPQTLRGSTGYGWGQARPGNRSDANSSIPTSFLVEYVLDAIETLKAELHINPEQIYLLGYDEGAAAAFQLGLGLPNRFAGIVAMNGWLPQRKGPLIWLPEARKLMIRLIHGTRNRIVSMSEAEKTLRVLFAAGIDTELHLIDAEHQVYREALMHVNQWVMERVAKGKRRTSKIEL